VRINYACLLLLCAVLLMLSGTPPVAEDQPTAALSLLVNCDDDDTDGRADFAREPVSPPPADNDISAFSLPLPQAGPAGTIKLQLASAQGNAGPCVRVFGPDGAEWLGPTAGSSKELDPVRDKTALDLWKKDGAKFRAEALLFGRSVALSVNGKHALTIDNAPLGPAPATLPIAAPGDVFVSDDNLASELAQRIGPPSTVAYPFCQNVAEACIQQIGLGKEVRAMPVFLRLVKTAEWEIVPRPDVGVFDVPWYGGAPVSLELGGAIEGLPPRADGRPRALVSRRGEIRSRVTDFLRSSGCEVYEIDLSGLWIDHLNELVCVIPCSSGFNILLADVASAVAELRNMPDGPWPVPALFYCEGGQFNPQAIEALTVARVRSLYTNGDRLSEGAARLQAAIDGVAVALTNPAGPAIPAGCIIRIPVLFDATRTRDGDTISGKIWSNYRTLAKKVNYLNESACNSLPVELGDKRLVFTPSLCDADGPTAVFRKGVLDAFTNAGFPPRQVVFVNMFPKFMSGGQVGCCANALRMLLPRPADAE